MRIRFVDILRSPEAGEGGGTPEPKAPDYTAELGKHKGDSAAMAMALFQDNAKLHGDVARLKGERDEAKKLAPPAGSRVLTADEAKKLDAYLALGEPADLSKALDAGKEAAGKVAAFEREKIVGEAGAIYGYKPEVLAKLAGADLAIEINPKGKRDGKEAKVAEVVVREHKDGKDVEQRVALDEYAKQHWGDFLPSLAPKPEAPARTTPSFARTEELVNHQANGQPELIRSVF